MVDVITAIRVNRDWTPSAELHAKLFHKVVKGQLGYVYRENGEDLNPNKGARCMVRVGTSWMKCYLPPPFLDLGLDVPIIFPVVTETVTLDQLRGGRRAINLAASQEFTTSKLTNVAASMYKAFADHMDELVAIGARGHLPNVLRGGIVQWTRGFIRTIPQVISTAITGGNIPVARLWTIATGDILSLTKSPGIYALIYRTKDKYALYIGKTVSIRNRCIDHASATNSEQHPQCQHYIVARGADAVKYLVLNEYNKAVLGEAGSAPDNQLRVAEQVWIVLMKTYTTNSIATRVNAQDLTATADAVQLNSSGWMARHALNATAIWGLARPVLQKYDWPTAEREWSGLNTSSPIFERNISAAVYWTRIDVGDRYVFRRQPIKHGVYRARGDAGHIAAFGTIASSKRKKARKSSVYINMPRNFQLDGNTVPMPPSGTDVYIQLEIMKTGVHPESHFCMPREGCFADWRDMFKLGKFVCYITWALLTVEQRSPCSGSTAMQSGGCPI